MPLVLPQVPFKASVSKDIFLSCIIVKKKCSPFNQGIIQQHIMSINKVITPMTELSEPPSYMNFAELESLMFTCQVSRSWDIGTCSCIHV